MTLIAAFRTGQTPTVVGDLLTTSANATGKCRKTVLIAPNLAIAWTGFVIAAGLVINYLERHAAQITNFASLEKLLVGFSVAELGSQSVTIIGWHVDGDGPHCFRWNSLYSSEVFTGDPMTDGSGDQFADRMLGTAGAVAPFPNIDGQGSIELGALMLACQFMRPELLGKSNEPLGFGFAYEVIILDQNGDFRYVDDLLYYSVCHRMDADGKHLESIALEPAVKIRRWRECVVVDTIHWRSGRMHRDVISPLGKNGYIDTAALAKESWVMDRNAPFASAYYLEQTLFSAPNFVNPAIFSVRSTADGGGGVDVLKPNEIAFDFNTHLIESMFAAVRRQEAELQSKRESVAR